MATPFSNRCNILGELWILFKNDEDFQDFIEYNDLGLPLAYFVSQGMVTIANPEVEEYINETWEMLISGLNLDEDKEYTSLEEINQILGK